MVSLTVGVGTSGSQHLLAGDLPVAWTLQLTVSERLESRRESMSVTGQAGEGSAVLRGCCQGAVRVLPGCRQFLRPQCRYLVTSSANKASDPALFKHLVSINRVS